MEDADRVRDTAEKLAWNDRNELRLALDFETWKLEEAEDSVPELYLPLRGVRSSRSWA
ncbi:hypothetical protein [Alloyangia pacifica]|uniref:hypothetical protein n=1 Tax=Alloyangia pacifica TaxID=311180 RepID=UPI00131F02EA|nr:hypothetical protein [Alloyangia pacifica]